MKLNSNFISNIKDIFGSEGELWLDQLPAQISRLESKWNFKLVEVLPNLTYNIVAVVKYNNQDAILKVAVNNKILSNESKWLACFDDNVPKLYWHDDAEAAYLMERLSPGVSLKQLVQQGHDNDATEIICSVILKLQTHQHPKSSFKHIAEHAKTLDVLHNQVDQALLIKAKSLFQRLTTDRTKDIILHGDLHHDNILKDKSSWKAIDPHGYMGDPAFEVGSMIVNPFDCFPQHMSLEKIIDARLKILCEKLPFESWRIYAWSFCKTMLSVAWTFEDHKKMDDGELEIARYINTKYIV